MNDAVLTDDTMRSIAAVLGGQLVESSFSEPDTPAYQLTLRNQKLDTPMRVLLWPSLSRVDVQTGDCLRVLKDMTEVRLFLGVELQFRRDNPPGMLFIGVQGRVVMVA